MKKFLLTFFISLFFSNIYAQNVGIGTTKPHPSAALDVTDTKKGILIPRMTAEQRNAIQNAAAGLMVYQTDGTGGYWYYNGASWTSVVSLDFLLKGGSQNQTLSWCNGVLKWGPCVPTLITTQPGSITSSGAVSGGSVSDDGGNPVTTRGVVWSVNPSPTIDLFTKTTDGSGSGTYPSNIVDLKPLTVYYVRAYATNSAGTAYGNEVSFVTNPALATISTTNVSAVTGISAISGGTITNNGGANVTARGVVWSSEPNPTLTANNGITTDGSGSGAFASNLSSLFPATVYYVRAYATNSAGTAYGNQISFKTNAVLPTLTTTPASSITGRTAVSGGDITYDGGMPITARGVIWSTSPNPTVNLLTKTNNGTGSGIFMSNISNLQPVTTYYVRAYATNSMGTAYGNQITFTTTVALPTLTTTAVTSISETAAISGGNITNNGGAAVTARGIVWSTSPNPTVDLSTKTLDGIGNGAFASNLSSLTNNTTYYVRAYATNSAGTAYGNEVNFKTIAPPPVTINNGLVGFWPFNGNANDESGSGNNGTVNGATLTTDRFGNASKAYSFINSSNRIVVSNTLIPNSPTSYSISMWIFNNNNNGGDIICDRSTLNFNYKYRLFISNNTLNFFTVSANNVSSLTKPNLSNSTWYHVVAIGNAVDKTTSLFFNGTLVGISNFFYPSHTNPTTFGANFAPTNTGFDPSISGKLDDIRIYNRILTQEEITYLANN